LFESLRRCAFTRRTAAASSRWLQVRKLPHLAYRTSARRAPDGSEGTSRA
jgi:hypothetical protein